MSATNAFDLSGMEHQLPNTVTRLPTDYATKADIERVIERLERSEKELKTLFQKIVDGLAAGRRFDENCGYGSSMRSTPESSTLEATMTGSVTAELVTQKGDSRDAAILESANQEPPVQERSIRNLHGREDDLEHSSVGHKDEASSSDAVPVTATAPVLVPETPDYPESAAEALAVLGTSSPCNQWTTPAPINPVTCREDTNSTTPSITSTVTSPPEPLHAFPILKAALEAADLAVLFMHVDFPLPHTPLPINGLVEEHRTQDLDRLHEVFWSVVLKGSLHNLMAEEVAENRVTYHFTAMRSLSCAIEHFIAVTAMKDPEATVGRFIRQEMKSRENGMLSDEEVEVLRRIAQQWTVDIDAVKSVHREKETLTQDELAALKTRNDPEAMDEKDTARSELEVTAPSCQEKKTEITTPDEPQKIDTQATSPSASARTASTNQQPVQIPDISLSQGPEPFGINNEPVQANSSTSNAGRENNALLTTEVLKLTSPLSFPSNNISYITDELRRKCVIGFAHILEIRNPSSSSWNLCRLREDQIPEMARHMELRILMQLEQDIIKMGACPSSETIIQEYIKRAEEKADKYRNKSRKEVSQAVKRFHRLCTKKWDQATSKVYSGFAAMHANWSSFFVSRPGRLLRVPPPPPLPIPVIPNVSNENFAVSSGNLIVPTVDSVISVEIDMMDDFTETKAAAEDKSQYFRPGRLTINAVLNQVQGNGHPKSSQQGVTNAPHTPRAIILSNDTKQIQNGSTSSNGQVSEVPTSTQLAPNLLAQLQASHSETQTGLTISNATRSEMIVDFHGMLVDANTKIPRLSQGLEIDLFQKCVLAGIAPFWNNFVALSPNQIAELAKRTEADVVRKLEKNAQGKSWDQSTQEIEYCKLASQIGPKGTPEGLERFAEAAGNLLEEEKGAMVT
ncbi:hypothetical protein BDW02DRAFT_595125 [Decorospora gaudefroyi]|uniref:Uncharacterized protein n=1 Tax=Decorospora gaudefroyi TaxID=184978 RepID=A0A6A5KW04_9PLEO|nr:hypothetical protein BDW02DRAFT_595125 [Decorospora gaudefroyi]